MIQQCITVKLKLGQLYVSLRRYYLLQVLINKIINVSVYIEDSISIACTSCRVHIITSNKLQLT